MKIGVSVVVPSFNRDEVLLKCVEALKSQHLSPADFEVIVVDDCSKQKAQETLAEIRKSMPNLIILRHQNNRGLAAARNTGGTHANFRTLLFLDSDIVPSLNFVKSHLEFHNRSEPTKIAAVSNLSYPRHLVETSNFGRFVNSRYLGNRSKWAMRSLNYENLPGKNFGGGISSLNHATFDALGGFDESFVKYGGEDEDMGFRLQKAGIKIKFCHNAKAIHYDSVSIKRFKLKAAEWSQNALPILKQKHPDYLGTTKLAYFFSKTIHSCKVGKMPQTLISYVLKSPTLQILERYLELTDRIRWLYFPPFYRILAVGWILMYSKQTKPAISQGVWK